MAFKGSGDLNIKGFGKSKNSSAKTNPFDVEQHGANGHKDRPRRSYLKGLNNYVSGYNNTGR